MKFAGKTYCFCVCFCFCFYNFNLFFCHLIDIGALDKVKETLKELVMLPLQRPELFRRGNLTKPVKGILLFGPPGTGKTMLAKAIATECGANFISIRHVLRLCLCCCCCSLLCFGSFFCLFVCLFAMFPSQRITKGVSMASIGSKWFGEGEKYARAVFTLASKISPCVIFMDEVDSILGRRERHGEHEAMRKIKNEIMMMWDGLLSDDNERVLVLAATNRPQDLDDAVLRRLSRRLLVDLPDGDNRKKILKVILQEEALDDDVSYEQLSTITAGFSGSDLKNLCVAAAYQPIREFLQKEKVGCYCCCHCSFTIGMFVCCWMSLAVAMRLSTLSILLMFVILLTFVSLFAERKRKSRIFFYHHQRK